MQTNKMCLYPKLIKNPKYKANKKNGGNIPAVLDERVKLVPVGCQKCIECRKQKARGWMIRLLEDIKTNKNGKFITLTFAPEELKKLNDECEGYGYEKDNNIATLSVRRFLERWRKEFKKSVRHWLITELGQTATEHLHLHGIIWTDDVKAIHKHWKYGNVWSGYKKNGKNENYVNASTVNYITKYITKQDTLHKNYQSKILCSKGIGNNYTNTVQSKSNKFKDTSTEECYRTEKGYKIAMPNYWRNKIYTDDEREKLWLQKLDKNERWICGEKISADNEDEYMKLLEYYRRLNKKLGYGSDEITWEQAQYERERRLIKQYAKMNYIKDKNNKK